MKRLAVLALLLTLAVPLRAQTSGEGYYCGPTGFDTNLGVTTKSFRCSIQKLQRGSGTLTLNGTSTVTVAPGSPGFSAVVTPDAVPGADGVFFKTSGLWYRFGTTEYYLRISAKASNSSITALAGAAGSANSGTTTEWGTWSVTCYRSASTSATFNVTLDHVDPRIWGSFDSGAIGDYSGLAVAATMRQLTYASAAGATTPVPSIAMKPRGFRVLLGNILGIGGVSPPANANQINLGTPQFSSTNSFRNSDVQFSMSTSAATAYPVACIWSSR